MAYAFEQARGSLDSGSLSHNDRRKLRAALERVHEAGSGRGYGSAAPSVGVRQNPGIAMGPPQSTSGYAKSLAKQAALGFGMGFGFGPIGALSMAKTAFNPSTFSDTGMTNIPGLGTIATKPGPLGPMLDMLGFGGVVRAAGALNAANLNRIAATDPNASFVSGPGWAGAFSNGTYSGTLPGGLEAATRRAMIHNIGQAHYDRQRDRRERGYGSGAQPGKPDNAGATRGGGRANPGNTHF